MVKRCNSGSDTVHIHDYEVEKNETFSFLSHVDWLQLFMSVRQIAIKLTEECAARVEAVSIMKIILIRTEPCSARAK